MSAEASDDQLSLLGTKTNVTTSLALLLQESLSEKVTIGISPLPSKLESSNTPFPNPKQKLCV
jgi:hypothetical protein